MAAITPAATSGTNAFVWGNLLAIIGSVVPMIFTPDFVANLLGSKYALFLPAVMALINWLGHGLTGNSATSIVPGVVAPSNGSNLQV